MERRALKAAAAALSLLSLGCVQTAVLDSGRALRRGEKVALAAGGADIHGRARYLYDPPYSERWDEPPPDQAKSWPSYRAIPKLGYAFRIGLGAGAQLDVFGFNFIGFGLGLKWQLIGGADGPFALALGGRATASGFGDGESENNGQLTELAAQGLLHLSVHPAGWLDLYAAPQLLADRLSHSVTRKGIEASTTATATAFGAGGGAIAWLAKGAGLCADLTVVRFTAEGERRSWLTTATFGWLQRL